MHVQLIQDHFLKISWECMFLGSLSHHNKDLEWWTLKPPWRVTAFRSWIDRVIALRSQMDHVIALRQISVTAQCYSSILFRRQQENPFSRHEGTSIQRHEEKSAPARGRERERESALAPLFICFFLPGPVLYKLGQPGVFTWGSHSGPQTFLCSIFAGFSLPCLLATTILDSCFLF